MQRHSNGGPVTTPPDALSARPAQSSANDTSHRPAIAAQHGPMKLIPWEDIWASLRTSRVRGHGEMIEEFYETLFKEAIFDDNGAWSEVRANHH